MHQPFTVNSGQLLFSFSLAVQITTAKVQKEKVQQRSLTVIQQRRGQGQQKEGGSRT